VLKTDYDAVPKPQPFTWSPPLNGNLIVTIRTADECIVRSIESLSRIQHGGGGSPDPKATSVSLKVNNRGEKEGNRE